jgi:iron complex outermembrane recepter protein
MPSGFPARLRTLAASLVLLCAALAAPVRGAESPEPDPGCTLSGRVTTTRGAALEGVIVSLAELARTTRTDSLGHYRLPNLPPGSYHASFASPGHAPALLAVDLPPAGATLDVTLREAAITLEPIQVSASAEATAPRDSPQPASVLSGAQLRDSRVASLGGTLDGLPGLWNSSSGADVGKPVIRGLRSDRVLVAYGGQRTETQQWADDDAPNLDLQDAERIEVVRGPASVLYGADALGGVIRILPRTVPTAFNESPLLRSEGAAGFGSNNRLGEGSCSVEGARGGLGFRIGLSGRASSDQRSPERVLDNSASRALNASAALGAVGSWGSLQLRLTHHGETNEILPDPVADSGATPVQRNADELAQVSLVRALGAARLEANVGLERNERREFVRRDDPDSELVNGVLSHTVTADLKWHQPLPGGWKGLVGTSVTRSTFGASGSELQAPPATSTVAGVYTFAQSEAGRCRYSVGARLENSVLDVDVAPRLAIPAQRRIYSALTGSGGVVFRICEPLAAVVDLSRGYRPPSLIDLFSSGADEGSQTFQAGNPDLRVERSLDLDGALRLQSAHLSGELAAYVNEISDFIYTRPSGASDSATGLPKYVTIQGDARLEGVEASLAWNSGSGASARAGADFVRGDNLSTGHPLPWVPPLRLTGELRYDAARLGGLGAPHVECGVELDATQTRLDPNDTGPPGYGLLRAGAGFETPIGGRSLTWTLTVRNILDKSYASFLSRQKSYASAPGRAVLLRVSN